MSWSLFQECHSQFVSSLVIIIHYCRTMTASASRPSRKRALATVAIMAAFNVTPSQCFGTTATWAPPRTAESISTTTRFFRSPNDDMILEPKADFSYILGNAFTAPHSTDILYNDMPTWLSFPRSHLVEKNRMKLREVMVESFFTDNEVLKLVYAMDEAAEGDADLKAGAAEFCLILVETMEMGVSSLVAAAFHYCSCVRARRSHSLKVGNDKEYADWEFRAHDSLESFGTQALQIERDAARLKRLEVVASKVIQNSGNGCVSPDSTQAENLRKLFLSESKDWRALAIRSAASLFRLRGIIQAGNSSHLTPESVRISREALHLYAPLASRLGMHRLKNELEEAAFRVLYRRQYETVTSLLHQTRDDDVTRRGAFGRKDNSKLSVPHKEADIGFSMEQIMASVQADMTTMLKNDPQFSTSVEDFTVTARVKEAYSTWKKMLRNGSDHIFQVPDAIALRIVLNAKKDTPEEDSVVTRARERALCYYSQKLCMARWAPKDNARFKDYIEHPKTNGYQSLHYTASTQWEGEDWSLEIQVRSGEMHKVDEFGLASHWDYKARSKPSTGAKDVVTINEHLVHSSDAYLRSLQEYHWRQHGDASQHHASPASDEPFLFNQAESKVRTDRIRARTQRLQPYIEALTETQFDLAREHVFVFFSQSEDTCSTEGKVLALPAGAVVLDALRKCGCSMVSESDISHNGSPATSTSRLHNGDILTIPPVTACVTH
jgi:ppGpp synthetase/RelA/SpoT-type nucleotidyltranferase